MRDLAELERFKVTVPLPRHIAEMLASDARRRGASFAGPLPTEMTFYEIDGLKVMFTNQTSWEHASISPITPGRTPTWTEMCKIKEIFYKDDETVLQYHPPFNDHVNHASDTLHLWRLQNGEFPLPSSLTGLPPKEGSGTRNPGIKDLSDLSECRLGEGDKHNGTFQIERNGRNFFVVTSTAHSGWDCVTVNCQQSEPSWEDMHHMRKMFMEREANGIQIHPPKSIEKNLPPNTLEIWIPHYERIPSPDPNLVGGMMRTKGL